MKMLNLYQVAERLGVSVFTATNYIRTGKIKGIKLERVYRVEEKDLENFIKSRVVKVE